MDGSATDAACVAELGPVEISDRDVTLFDSGGVWRLDATAQNGLRLVLRTGRHPGRAYHALEVGRDLREGQVTLDPAELTDEPDPFALRAPLHELWTQFLLWRGRGALVHACGLLCDNRVHLFVGPSGAGKSTLAGILAGRYGEVLSDDRVVIRPEKAGFCAYGTPWHGEARFASARSGPLTSLSFLMQAPGSQRRVLTHDRAAAQLVANCFMAGWPRGNVKELLEMCVGIVKSVPCFELAFTPDDSAARAAGLEPVS